MLRLACTVAVLFSIAPAAWAQAGSVEGGRAIAERNCARCHAVGRQGESVNPRSPPFRTLAQRYPLKDLEESMAEGLMVGHEGPEMPVFEFRPGQIADLMAYLARIQVRRR